MTRRNGNTFVSRNVIKSGAKKSKQFSKWILNDENKENDVFSVTDTSDSKKMNYEFFQQKFKPRPLGCSSICSTTELSKNS